MLENIKNKILTCYVCHDTVVESIIASMATGEKHI